MSDHTQSGAIEWVGIKPEDRKMTLDYCEHCGISRGAPVLNYRGPCKHEWERVVFRPEAPVREYLDDAITKWRAKRKQAEAQALADEAALIPPSEGILVARCYVDAFQSVRVSVFGETLP